MDSILSEFWGLIPTIISILLAYRLMSNDKKDGAVNVSNLNLRVNNVEDRLDRLEKSYEKRLDKIELKIDELIGLILEMAKN